jgi:hypothetical protein
MTKTLTRFSALAMLCLFFACQKKSAELTTSGRTALSEETCVPVVYPLSNDYATYGEVTVWNDDNFMYVKFTAAPGYLLKRASGIYGTYAHLQTVLGDDWDPTTGPTPPDFTQSLAPEVQSYTFNIPHDDAFLSDDCIWLNVHAVIVQKDGSGNVIATKYLWAEADDYVTSASTSRSFRYCRMSCPPPPPPPPPPGDCDTLRTNTPGGWGAQPSGNNAGAYLHMHFDNVFTSGLTVGCYPGNYYVRLTSAQAITDLLPTGGQAAVLTSSLTNPSAIKNVLVGHLVALKLSVGFDANDPDFGQGGVTLGAMQIGSGVFENMTVAEFIAAADKVLGGCSSDYTPTQILETATAINENYIDGLIDNGFLVCPVIED